MTDFDHKLANCICPYCGGRLVKKQNHKSGDYFFTCAKCSKTQSYKAVKTAMSQTNLEKPH